ncbi:hypothetical protein ACFLS7_03055 [Bacteroidota bacterium]
MKTKKIIILFALLSISSLSCKEILMLRYGIHQPREETPESIMAFMNKMDYPNENTFLFKDSSAFYTCMRDSTFRSNVLSSLFFSPQGLLINIKDTSMCQWSGGYFVRNLHHDSLYQSDSAYTLGNLMRLMTPLNGNTVVDTVNADYIVVVIWASFLGRYNERLFSIREAIHENTDVAVKPVFLCIDMQKSWNLTARDMEVFQFN